MVMLIVMLGRIMLDREKQDNCHEQCNRIMVRMIVIIGRVMLATVTTPVRSMGTAVLDNRLMFKIMMLLMVICSNRHFLNLGIDKIGLTTQFGKIPDVLRFFLQPFLAKKI